MEVIPWEFAHRTIRQHPVWCAGSSYPPTASSDGHGICEVCEQPFLLCSGLIPEHRA